MHGIMTPCLLGLFRSSPLARSIPVSLVFGLSWFDPVGIASTQVLIHIDQPASIFSSHMLKIHAGALPSNA